MDLHSKLKYYKSQQREKKPQESAADTPALSALAEHFRGIIQNPSAPFLQIERRHPLAYAQELAAGNDSRIQLSFLSRNQLKNPFPLSSVLFFDLETTGLAGGAGTYPFLLGFGWVENDALVVRQFLLPDYGREYGLYHYLQEEFFPSFEILVSYNGKSYDLPLLKNRFILNRLQPLFDRWPHLDLLHVARRIWKDSFYSCDLVTIESNILDYHRQNDIPGYYIPQAYFNFIRTGVIHDIIRIIEHNYRDIVSLAKLLLTLERIEQQPHTLTDPRARLNLARLAFEQQNETLLSRLSASFALKSPEYVTSRFWLSLLHKKNNNWTEAEAIWLELREREEQRYVVLEELAKYQEHIRKDYHEALRVTEQALHHLDILNELDGYGNNNFSEIKQQFEYRQLRLKRKLS